MATTRFAGPTRCLRKSRDDIYVSGDIAVVSQVHAHLQVSVVVLESKKIKSVLIYDARYIKLFMEVRSTKY